MRLRVNGVQLNYQETLTISELLQKRDVGSPQTVSVELNEVIIPQNKFDSIQLKDNDRLQFLFSASGGKG